MHIKTTAKDISMRTNLPTVKDSYPTEVVNSEATFLRSSDLEHITVFIVKPSFFAMITIINNS